MSTDPVFMKSGNQYYWYHNDHLSTPQMMTNNSGAVVWKAKYTAFGKATVDSASTVVNPLRFAGQYFDQETGLHYNYHRYYNPQLGRYLRADPLFEDPDYLLFGIINTTNRYDYVRNNPIRSTDPKGLSPMLQGGGGGWEGHFIYGYGRDTFYCCDGCDLWRIRTSKHCLGAGFLLSGGLTGQFTGLSRKNTCPDGYGGIACEFGFGPGEYGLGIGSSGITNSLGLGGGAGGKATVCYYRVLEKKKISKCSL